MTNRPTLPPEIRQTQVIAIIRGNDVRRLSAVVDALLDGGLRCVEITMTIPDALGVLRDIVAAVGDRACVGAGTVLDTDQARAALDAGARFLVAPCLVPEVMTAVPADVPVIPGAFTATEILAAWGSGAAAVKVFPAATGGPGYLRDIRGPLPDIPLIPTGGIAVGDVAAYLAAGAVAVGLGGSLLGDALAGGDLTALKGRAAEALAAARCARSG